MARSSRGSVDYNWSGGIGNGLVGTASVLAFSINSGQAQTLRRVCGVISLQIDGPTDGDIHQVGVGVIIATDAAIAAGAASLPSSLTDLDAEWVWHQFVPLQVQAIVTGVGEFGRTIEIDSKAMRKLKSNSNIALVLDGSRIAGTPTTDFVAGMRILASD